jgi:hypothetical protein
VVVTTLKNNADTLDACSRSVAWVDDLVVLDSGFSDATLAIAAWSGTSGFADAASTNSRDPHRSTRTISECGAPGFFQAQVSRKVTQ